MKRCRCFLALVDDFSHVISIARNDARLFDVLLLRLDRNARLRGLNHSMLIHKCEKRLEHLRRFLQMWSMPTILKDHFLICAALLLISF